MKHIKPLSYTQESEIGIMGVLGLNHRHWQMRKLISGVQVKAVRPYDPLLPTQMTIPWTSWKRKNKNQIPFKNFFLAGKLVVQSLSHVRLFVTLWTVARQASPSITNSNSLLKLMSIKLVMPSNLLIFCCPLLLLPSIFSSIRVFFNESVLCIKWPKYWSFSFSISLSNEYSGLISFRIDWLDLLAVQVSLRSLLQHHSSKASVLQHH